MSQQSTSHATAGTLLPFPANLLPPLLPIYSGNTWIGEEAVGEKLLLGMLGIGCVDLVHTCRGSGYQEGFLYFTEPSRAAPSFGWASPPPPIPSALCPLPPPSIPSLPSPPTPPELLPPLLPLPLTLGFSLGSPLGPSDALCQRDGEKPATKTARRCTLTISAQTPRESCLATTPSPSPTESRRNPRGNQPPPP